MYAVETRAILITAPRKHGQQKELDLGKKNDQEKS
jgi:hypothetical protein